MDSGGGDIDEDDRIDDLLGTERWNKFSQIVFKNEGE